MASWFCNYNQYGNLFNFWVNILLFANFINIFECFKCKILKIPFIFATNNNS